MGRLTKDQKKILVDKWNAGVPASVIASHLTALGAPSTKNSVIGHANRLRQGGADVRKKKAGRTPASKPVPVSAEGCRFIEGHPTGQNSDYCNAPRVWSSPYCAEHRARTLRRPGEIEA